MNKKKDIGDKNINYQNLTKFKENLDKIIPKQITLTQAEYDLLSDEEKYNGTIYFISDGTVDISEADKDYIDNQDAQTLTTAKEYTDDTAEGTLTSAKNYTNEKISDLINGAPETLDTLKEISDAMDDNKDVVDALEEAIGTRATTTDLTAHTNDTGNPHKVTKTHVGLDKVENKSSADIRGELTKSDVTTALGFTPPTNGFKKYSTNFTYTERETAAPIGSCTIPYSTSDGFLIITSQYEQYLYLITCRSDINISAIKASSTTPSATRNGNNNTITISNIPYMGSMQGGLAIYSFS